MGNSWKAKCVETKDYLFWNIGDVIEVEDGVVVKCKGDYIGVREWYTQSILSWSELQNYSKWELITDETIEEVTDILGNTLSRVISDSDETSSDNINPNHYKSQCSLECIESMIMAFGIDTVYYFCICNAWKYIWRYQNKNGVEDIKKARWYVNKAKELIPEYLEWQNINEVLTTIERDMTKGGIL